MFSELSPVVQALIMSFFTWGVTALGSATVFFTKEVNKKTLDVMLGFGAGVMIAASFWSLLAPALHMSETLPIPWLPAAVGFLGGGIFLRLIDKFLPHFHPGLKKVEGVKTHWHKNTLLILAITLHNFPEGLAVGVAFGAVAAGIESASLAGAIALAIGIGLQNFPEGMAVSFPLRRAGVSKWKAFWAGQMSAVVEPIAAVLGAGLVLISREILPYALAFAAGAMIFVCVEEMIPESQEGDNGDIATMGTIVGFVVMMILDVALG
jgi:ZIP family zinc transporter